MKSLWGDDEGGTPANANKTAKADVKEKVWQVECKMYRTQITTIVPLNEL
jgi:hypothetical protein